MQYLQELGGFYFSEVRCFNPGNYEARGLIFREDEEGSQHHEICQISYVMAHRGHLHQ